MLSPTYDEMPNFTYASPEEIRDAQEKALNLWVGATSPLWAPFWLASTVGVGLWALSQGFKRTQETLGAVPDGISAWVGGTSATDVAATVQTMVDDGVIAPMQAAGKAIQDMTTAVTPSPQAIAEHLKSASDEATETAAKAAEVTTVLADHATAGAVETFEAQADAAADVAEDAGSLLPADAPAAAVAADTAVSASDAVPPPPRKPRKG